MIEDYKIYIQEKLLGNNNSIKSSHTKNNGKWIKENHFELYNLIMSNIGNSIPEKIYLLMNDLTEYPICPICKKTKLMFTTYSNGYKAYCSSKCSNNSKDKQNKSKKTCLSRYGVDSPSKNEIIKEKIKNTCLQKYGGNSPISSEDVKDKIKNTCLERYGTEHASQSNIIKDKIKNTCLERYNETNVSSVKEVRSKAENTCLERYGTKYPIKLEEIKDKVKETCLEKYGVTSILLLDSTKDSFKNKYNVNNPMKCEIIKNKQKRTIKTNRYELFKEQIKQKGLELLSSRTDFINKDEFNYKCNICRNIIYKQ